MLCKPGIATLLCFAGDACRYPADVVPFAAIAAPGSGALRQLHSLLAPNDPVWLIGESYPRVPELSFEEKRWSASN